MGIKLDPTKNGWRRSTRNHRLRDGHTPQPSELEELSERREPQLRKCPHKIRLSTVGGVSPGLSIRK